MSEPKDRAIARYQGEASQSPYPLSRMAPSFGLVDLAKEIERADAMVATVATEKLLLLAEQIRALQEKAQEILEKTNQDAVLHRARCNFEKKPGGVYHLYEDESGVPWFSLLGPAEWVLRKPKHLGSYRLENDASFTALADIQAQDERRVLAVGTFRR